jgi:hypothetical protein
VDQAAEREAAGSRWQDTGGYSPRPRVQLGARHIRKMFQDICERPGFGRDWARRDLRHTFVWLLSDDGMAIAKIARLVGHASSHVTETVYRQELRPVLQEGAYVMDRAAVLPRGRGAVHPGPALRQGEERLGVPYQAGDRRGPGGQGRKGGVRVPGGRRGQRVRGPGRVPRRTGRGRAAVRDGAQAAPRTWACSPDAHTPVDAARALAWDGPEDPGDWTPGTRAFLDGHAGTWWAADARLDWEIFAAILARLALAMHENEEVCGALAWASERMNSCAVVRTPT